MRAGAINFAAFANALCHLNAMPLNKAKMGQCLGGGLLSLSLSLSLSLLALLARLCVQFKKNFSHTQILKQKFKFFTQNSTHFITLSQILSPTQGFFIFLPQIFAQCKLINFNTRRKNGNFFTKHGKIALPKQWL